MGTNYGTKYSIGDVIKTTDKGVMEITGVRITETKTKYEIEYYTNAGYSIDESLIKGVYKSK